jgi:hypothetical protein
VVDQWAKTSAKTHLSAVSSVLWSTLFLIKHFSNSGEPIGVPKQETPSRSGYKTKPSEVETVAPGKRIESYPSTAEEEPTRTLDFLGVYWVQSRK